MKVTKSYLTVISSSSSQSRNVESYDFCQEETGFYLICHVSSNGNVCLLYIYTWKPYLVWLRQYFKLCSGVWDNIIHKLHWPLPFKLLIPVSHAPLTLSRNHSITLPLWENVSPYAHNVGQNECLVKATSRYMNTNMITPQELLKKSPTSFMFWKRSHTLKVSKYTIT